MAEPIITIQGKDDKGEPWKNYSFVKPGTNGEPIDGFLGHIMYLGPVVQGTILLKDGTGYDLTPDHIDCKPEHVGAINHHVALWHVANGTLDAHTCTDDCGDERTE